MEVAYEEELGPTISDDDLDTRKEPKEAKFCGSKLDECKVGIGLDGVSKWDRWFVWRFICCRDASSVAGLCTVIWGTV